MISIAALLDPRILLYTSGLPTGPCDDAEEGVVEVFVSALISLLVASASSTSWVFRVMGRMLRNEGREGGLKTPDGGAKELRPGVVEVGRKVVFEGCGVDDGARGLSSDGGRSEMEG